MITLAQQKFADLKEKFTGSGQEHLWNQLDKAVSNWDDQEDVLGILENLDLELVNRAFNKPLEKLQISPVPEEYVCRLQDKTDEQVSTWSQLGLDTIKEGSVGIILLAGGQGTRLGSSVPKALFDIKLPSRKNLLQLQAEKILKLEELAGGKIGCWYIMTSPSTYGPLEECLETNGYYGLDVDRVKLFCQGQLPSLDQETGHILMADETSPVFSPDGNGGLYKALGQNNLLEDMQERGVEHLFVYCVDNVLVKVSDPVFLGYCLEKGAQVGNKVVRRLEGENAGLTCMEGDRPGVREYSEMEGDEEVGDLANICIHYFSRNFLSRVLERERQLPIHLAKKKIPYMDLANGESVKPSTPNGYKLEKFVFDSFRFVEPGKFCVYEVARENEFSPLKQAEGSAGTPAVCRRDVSNLHTRWLMEAGAELVGDKELEVEVSPEVSYGGEGLSDVVQGKLLECPLHLTKNKRYF